MPPKKKALPKSLSGDEEQVDGEVTEAPPVEEGPKSIAEIMKKVTKSVGIRPISLRPRDKGDLLSTGCLTLDLILGGGYPGGRVVQYYGKSHSGKSTLMYTTAGCLHKRGVYTLFFDHEATTDPAYAARLGFDTTSSSYYKPSSGEETYRMIEGVLDALPFCDSGPPQVAFIIDSIATMPTEKELGEDKSNQQALRAAMHSKWLGILKTKISAKNACVIAVNQIRSNAGAMYTAPEVLPGGNAWEFDTDVLVKVSRSGKFVEVEHNTYQPVTFKTVKNRSFIPNQEQEVFLHLGQGFDPSADIIQFLKQTGYYVRPPKKAPSIVGLNAFADQAWLTAVDENGKSLGHTLDRDFRSSAELEATLRAEHAQAVKPYRDACERMLATGDAAQKYLDMKKKAPPVEKKKTKDLNVMQGDMDDDDDE